MNTTTTRRIARYIALPAAAAGIVGAAALGLAGAANADTTQPETRTSIVAVPQTYASPAPTAQPGYLWHHGVWHLHELVPGYHP